jgi:cytochrome c-L
MWDGVADIMQPSFQKLQREIYSMKFALIVAALSLTGLAILAQTAVAEQVFRNTATDEVLDVDRSARRGGRNTLAVKKFMETGVDAYVEVAGCLPLGEAIFAESCSGCHGAVGEGKIGPALNDSIWIYSKNKTDKGIFETIFGGAKGLMAAHGQDIELDDLLKLIAWVRHLQKDDVTNAEWLTAEQKKTFKSFDVQRWKEMERPAAEKQQCAIPSK